YGYPPDAILNTSLAITLARQIQALAVVTGTMEKNAEGRYVVTARLAGVRDDAGHVVVLTQNPGERSPDFAERLAEALTPAAKALEDAKACVDQAELKADRAVKA